MSQLVFGPAADSDAKLRASWFAGLSHASRQVGSNGANAAAQSVKDVLSGYLVQTTIQSFKLDEGITLYNNTRVVMEAYRTKPLTFDLILLSSVVSYLLALYAVIRGISGTIQDVTAFIKGTKPTSVAPKAKRS